MNLKCPVGKKLSFDNDSVAENDDNFSLICTSEGQYLIPKYLPKCVDSCWIRLPTPPAETGLEPVIPPNTIPTGSYGTYICRVLLMR